MTIEEALPLEWIQASLRHSFELAHAKLSKWISRFSHHTDSSILHELLLVYLKAGKKYLDHRYPAHICRLVQSIYVIQNRLIQFITLDESRWVEIKRLPTHLDFPFTSQTAIDGNTSYSAYLPIQPVPD